MISVIIPTYNSKSTLRRCIESVKNQTMTDWECVIVDDGSTDDTRAELDRLTDGDGRFTLVLGDDNQGLAAARNAGLMYAKGDMIYFLDSDDYIDRNTLEYLTSLAVYYPTVGVFATPKYFEIEKKNMQGIQEFGSYGHFSSSNPRLFESRKYDVGYASGNMYVKSNIPCDIHYPRVKVHEDMMCNMRLLFAGTDFCISDKPTYHYVRHIGSLIDTPLAQEEFNQIRRALAEAAKEFNPSDKLYERCKLFMENALSGRNVKD